MNRKYVRISEAVVRAELLPSRPVPVAVRYKAKVPPGAWMSVCLLSVVCCRAEVSAAPVAGRPAGRAV